MVFEGGASRTAFSCGVMDAFLEEELMPDYFIGVSAGIAFGVSYLSKQKGRNLKLLEEYMADKRYMGLKYLFDRKKKSYYNIGFVFDEVPNKLLPFDYETFAQYKGVVEACVTNIHTGKSRVSESATERGNERYTGGKLFPSNFISAGQNRKALLSGWRNRRFYPIPACFGGGLRQTDRRADQRAWLCEND